MGKNINFGINIIFNEDIFKAIDFASQNNFSAIEVWPVAPQFLIERFSKKQKGEIVKYSIFKNIQVQFHAPEGISLFLDNEELRKASTKYYKSLIDFAFSIKAKLITFHLGGITTLSFPGGIKTPIFKEYPGYFLQELEKNLREISEYAKGKVLLCIENEGYLDEKTIQEVIQKLLNGNLLFLTWDFAKTYKKDGKLKTELFDFMQKNIRYVKNAHIHDSSLTGGHEVIGSGFVDFKIFFEKTKELSINYIVEVRPHENALKSKQNFKNILNLT